MYDAMLCAAVVAGATLGTWLAMAAWPPAVAGGALAYVIVMHCPPFDLAGQFLHRRRTRRERWVVASRHTVFDRPIAPRG